MTTRNSLLRLCENNKDAVIIGSIGNISKELSTIDHPKKILIKGAMGIAMSVGLGYARQVKEPVIVVIGEGAFLMRMGSMATIMSNWPDNLRVVILNNGCYASCGGQKNNFEKIKHLVPFEVYDDICEQE